jgi:signal transduction histidine kinase
MVGQICYDTPLMISKAIDLSIDYFLILFVYGLVFFSLGLVVLVYSRRSSRLELARSLKWLAAFGLLHGLNEWGELFILNYANQMGASTAMLLEDIHLLLLAVSFACLFQFGIYLVIPFWGKKWLNLLPFCLCSSLVISIFWLDPGSSGDYMAWHRLGNALTRYAIGLPGALLAAYGLRRQAESRVKPLNVPTIYNMLRYAGLGLVFYGLFAGLVVPPVNFFPGNWLNTATFLQVVGVPVIVFRSAVGVILAITIIRALEIFDVETYRLIEHMEQQQILAAERERIGRDLHDGAIQKAYSAGLIIESALRCMDDQNQASERLKPAVHLIQDTILDLRQNLIELHPAPTTDRLTVLLQQLSNEPRFRGLFSIQYVFDFRQDEPNGALRLHQIMAIANEALSNIARHARASKVLLSAKTEDGQFVLTIDDNGTGIDEDARLGFGVRNMRDRARLLNGKLDLMAITPHGTRVQLTMPLLEEDI